MKGLRRELSYVGVVVPGLASHTLAICSRQQELEVYDAAWSGQRKVEYRKRVSLGLGWVRKDKPHQHCHFKT